MHLFVDRGAVFWEKFGKTWACVIGVAFPPTQRGFFFQKTIVWTVNDQEKRRTVTVTTDNHEK